MSPALSLVILFAIVAFIFLLIHLRIKDERRAIRRKVEAEWERRDAMRDFERGSKEDDELMRKANAAIDEQAAP